MIEERISIPKNKKGVTLLELMVTLVITVLLGLAIFNVLKMAVDSWQKGEFATQKYQNARTALEKMGEDLKSALKYSSADPYEAEFSGASNRVDFLANIHSPVFFYVADKEESDLCEIGYFVSGTTLYRRKDTDPYPNDTDVNSGGTSEGIASHITNLSLTYYSANGSSFTSWDSATISSIPTRAKIEVTTRSDNPRHDDSEKVSTIVYLPASKQ